jgi:hypothetical protein
LGEITADPSWIALADRLLKGIEITCDSWIKEDKDLHYCYFADGSFGLVIPLQKQVGAKSIPKNQKDPMLKYKNNSPRMAMAGL